MEEKVDFISFEQAKEGFKKCHAVVHKLLSDAELLLKHGRYSSSVALAILALEETAKADKIRLKIRENEGLTKNEWQEISFGKGVHEMKLTSILERKAKKLDTLSEKQARFLNAIGAAIGLPDDTDLESVKSQTAMLKKIFPKLNYVKQECFYLDWDRKSKKWSYLDLRFDERTKKAVGYSLILQAKQIVAMQRFVMDLPNKPFVQYTSEEWEKVRNLSSLSELKKLLAEFRTREFFKTSDIALSAINSYAK